MLQGPAPRLILASASVSRRALLAAAGVVFDVRPADLDEAEVKRAALAEGLTASGAALRLAQLKAEQIAAREPDAVVIGADQILVCEGLWYDKPASVADARAQLLRLRGRRHELVTAVVCCQDRSHLWRHVAIPHLVMREFSEGFLSDYLEAEAANVTTTVGAYRLEGLGVQLFEAIKGDHSVILGLPLLPLLSFLRMQYILAA